MVIWGSAYPFAKFALREVSPLAFSAMRTLVSTLIPFPFFIRQEKSWSARIFIRRWSWSPFGIGGIFLLFYLPYTKVPLIWNKYVLYGCLIGAWWSGIMVRYYTAIARGPLSGVIPLFSLNLVIPAVLGFIFLNEPLTVSKGLGLLFACMAVILLTR
jgi:drug/metabolite transporter (DMT)-like permease